MSLKVAVVTPYFRDPAAWLRRCHASVQAQTHPCTHILVADGEPQEIVAGFAAQHIVLPVPSADYGDTPRAHGSRAAIEQGFDAIAYLDADNWFRPDHIASLVALHERTGAAVCTSKRTLHHVNGAFMGKCRTSDGEQFCDTSCLMLLRPAFALASVWEQIAPGEHPIDDRIMWQHVLDSGLSRAHSDLPTVAYTVKQVNIYNDLGWPLPAETPDYADAMEANARRAARGAGSLTLKWAYAFNSTALVNRGLEFIRLERTEEALASFDAAVGLRSTNADAHYYRGFCLQTLARHQEAAASFETATTLQPGNARAHYYHGFCLQALGRHEEALARFATALHLQPSDPDCHNTQAISLIALGRIVEALAGFDRALAIDPGHLLARRNREALLLRVAERSVEGSPA